MFQKWKFNDLSASSRHDHFRKIIDSLSECRVVHYGRKINFPQKNRKFKSVAKNIILTAFDPENIDK